MKSLNFYFLGLVFTIPALLHFANAQRFEYKSVKDLENDMPADHIFIIDLDKKSFEVRYEDGEKETYVVDEYEITHKDDTTVGYQVYELFFDTEGFLEPKIVELRISQKDDYYSQLIIFTNILHTEHYIINPIDLRKETRKQRREELNAKTDFGGIGYYASTKSLFGLNLIILDYSFGYGLSYRGNQYIFKSSIDKNDFHGIYKEKHETSAAYLIHVSKGIFYPVHLYIGAGPGVRGTLYELENGDVYKDYETGVETEAGVFINIGRFGLLRGGVTTNNFKEDHIDFTFGLSFNL